MKKISVTSTVEQSHSLMNDIVNNTANILGDAYLVIRLDEALKKRGINQKDLAQMTGIRVATISDLVNGKGNTINKVQLYAIMSALRVSKLSDIIEIRLPDDLEKQFIKEEQEWIDSKEMPSSVKKLYRENVLKASGLD